jgi:hypothetical protein
VLGFGLFLIVEHERVLGLEGGHLVIEAHETVLEVLELEELTLEGGNHVVFVEGLVLLVPQLVLGTSRHFLF